jgi:flagellar protein FliO/FliZ
VQSIFGIDIPQGVQWLLALAIVLGLVIVFGWMLRRFAGGKLRAKGQGNRARQPRLGVVDIYDLDRQRQLILLRRDNVEHLVMIGGPNDVVVETTILRSIARQALSPAQPEAVASPPDPAAQIKDAPPKEPGAEPVMPSLRSAGIAASAGAAAAFVAAQTSVADTVKAPSQHDLAVAPTMAEPAKIEQVKAELATLDPVKIELPKIDLPKIDLPKIDLPKIDLPKVDLQKVDLPKIENVPVTAAVSIPAIVAADPVVTPPPPIVVPAPSKPTSVELDDMNRQLESALKRPFAGAHASADEPKSKTASPGDEMSAAAAQQAEKALADALDMDFTVLPKEMPKLSTPAAKAPHALELEPAGPVMPLPESTKDAIITQRNAAPEPKAVTSPPVPQKPKPAPAAEAKPEPVMGPAKPAADPFSSEAIEAEFARLLGRTPDAKT